MKVIQLLFNDMLGKPVITGLFEDGFQGTTERFHRGRFITIKVFRDDKTFGFTLTNDQYRLLSDKGYHNIGEVK